MSKIDVLLIDLLLSASMQQETDILNNLYQDIMGFKSSIKKCKFLEKMAQKPSKCVRHHSHHDHLDQEIWDSLEKKYPSKKIEQLIIAAVMVCEGGCKEKSSDWNKEHPAKIFYLRRHTTHAYNDIMAKTSKYLGCSVTKDGEYCAYCLLSNYCWSM